MLAKGGGLETEAGSAWLKRLVVGSIFFFAIKHGIGVGELSQFLKALRLGRHVGCSPSALAQMKKQIKATIEASEVAQGDHCQPHEGQGICVGGDEVFFGLPVLVLAELASGYLLTEVQCEDRRYETWKAQIQHWWSQAGWQCHFMDVHNWVLGSLLPWVYWLQQTDKTHQRELKARYQQAANEAANQLVAHPLTLSMPTDERQTWIEWARWMFPGLNYTTSARCSIL